MKIQLIMKKTILFCLLACLSIVVRAEIANGTCGDNVTWSLSDDYVLTISGSGAMWNYSDSSDVPWDSYRRGISKAEIADGITSIGSEAFYDCFDMVSVDIPNSITSIGFSAFYNCQGLTTITIPNSVTSIGRAAFGVCYNLTSITIPSSVTSIGDKAFYNCRFSSIKVDAGNSTYDSRNGCNALIETSSNTLIVGCKNTIIPNTVTSIGGSAFYGCTGLTSIAIPNSVTSIGDGAFNCCYDLNSITIPNSVTSIGDKTFYACKGLTSVTIPNSITSIGGWAFYGCEGLTSIAIPSSVTSIGTFAFFRCKRLTSVTIPNSVTSLGSMAFYDCSDLVSLTISSSATSIGYMAFAKCSNLTEFVYLSDTPQNINSSMFSETDITTATLYVPDNSIAAYKAANVWSTFGSIKSVAELYSYDVNHDGKVDIQDITLLVDHVLGKTK